MKHAPFRIEFVWLALTAACVAGFPIGAHLSFVMGFGFALGPGFTSFVQTHGHLQLMGWTGLFVMGISLHFLPRLAGMAIAQPQWINRILWCMGTGLTLRSVAHPAVPYLHGSPAFIPGLVIVASSGLIEAIGIFSYVYLLFATLRNPDASHVPTALLSVRPFIGMMLVGWVLYAGVNLLLLLDMALRQTVVVHGGWNRFGIESFIGLVLLPVAFAVSVRTFPLYLRLAVPDWSIRRVGYVYMAALVLRLLPMVPWLQQLAPQMMSDLANSGMVLRGGVILWFVWQLDVLSRRRAPWTVNRRFHPGPERRATRPGLPDYGEFGRFERLVYAAYGWLVLSALSELSSGLTALLGQSRFVAQVAIWHMYLAGFITLLIFGMAVRMVPGFLRKRQLASPALVSATFWLGNAAVVGRVLLFVVPLSLLERFPGLAATAKIAFALSGLTDFAAVVCLAINLRKTARLA